MIILLQSWVTIIQGCLLAINSGINNLYKIIIFVINKFLNFEGSTRNNRKNKSLRHNGTSNSGLFHYKLQKCKKSS